MGETLYFTKKNPSPRGQKKLCEQAGARWRVPGRSILGFGIVILGFEFVHFLRSWTSIRFGVLCVVSAIDSLHLFVTLLVFTDAFLKANTLFGELYVLQLYNIAALMVICEVWQCCSCSVVAGILNHMFFGHVCFAFVPLCFAFHGLLAQYFRNVFYLLVWIEKWHFCSAIALLLGVPTLECCDVLLGASLILAGKIVILRFELHRLLRAMYWTFHVLRLSNMNVVVPLCLHLIGWLIWIRRL